MSNALKPAVSPGILVPAIEEVPRISDAERAKLLASLKIAAEDIARGEYDVVTPESLRAEFEAVFLGNKSDDEVKMAPDAGPPTKR